MHLDAVATVTNATSNKSVVSFDTELSAPIAQLDIEDWLIDLISSPPTSSSQTQAQSSIEPVVSTSSSSSDQFDDLYDGYSEEPYSRPTHSKSNLETIINNKSRKSTHRQHRRCSESTNSQHNDEDGETIDLCNSLEDLVKTFDKNVKECLKNYKNIDIGQLAPVQVRTEEDLINDSQ